MTQSERATLDLLGAVRDLRGRPLDLDEARDVCEHFDLLSTFNRMRHAALQSHGQIVIRGTEVELVH